MPSPRRPKLPQGPKERHELHEVIQAIRKGLVDAVLVETLSGERVYTLNPAANLEEHNEILEAIRGGRVDALLIKTPAGDRVFALQTTDEPYRVLVETMQEGAATVGEDGTVLYANARFAEIIDCPNESLFGLSLFRHFESSGDGKLKNLVEKGLETSTKGEVRFRDRRGQNRMLRLAASPLPAGDQEIRRTACLVVTDVTELFEMNESLRALSTRILQLQDEERTRISRDLHDSAGQYLAVAAMVLGQMQQSMSSSSADPMQKEALQPLIEVAQKVIRECSSEIRTISYLLHPPTLDASGLASAVHWYSQGFAERSGIQVDVEVTPSLGRLQQDVEITLYRIVQEALTNIHRHSGSKWAGIRLIRDQEQITLEVADRGKGMPTSRSEKPLRMGVGTSGMRERVRQLNGDFMIDSSEKGTTVRVTLNLAKIESSTRPESPAC